MSIPRISSWERKRFVIPHAMDRFEEDTRHMWNARHVSSFYEMKSAKGCLYNEIGLAIVFTICCITTGIVGMTAKERSFLADGGKLSSILFGSIAVFCVIKVLITGKEFNRCAKQFQFHFNASFFPSESSLLPIDSLEEQRKQSTANSVASKLSDCAICLHPKKSELTEVRCGHNFHFGCISKWLRAQGQKKNCPLCRSPLILSSKKRVIAQSPFSTPTLFPTETLV